MFTRRLAIILVLCCLAYISHVVDYMGVTMASYQYQAIFLALLLTLVFFSYPSRKGAAGVRWLDWIFVVFAIVPNGYVLLFHESWRLHEVLGMTPYEIAFGMALTVAVKH